MTKLQTSLEIGIFRQRRIGLWPRLLARPASRSEAGVIFCNLPLGRELVAERGFVSWDLFMIY